MILNSKVSAVHLKQVKSLSQTLKFNRIPSMRSNETGNKIIVGA
jgi:hypothetical protein